MPYPVRFLIWIWSASLLLVCLLVSAPASGQASRKTIYLKGKLERIEYASPNIVIHLAVKKGRGRMQHWVIETCAPNDAEKVGWSREMMKPGDQIAYEVMPDEKTELVAWGGNIITVNGRQLGTLTQPERVVVQGYRD